MDELLILKKRFKMSIQAILRRFLDLEIISPTYYKEWCIAINKMGWRKKEPLPIQPEKPEWLKQTVGRCLAEGFLTLQQAQDMTGEKLDFKESPRSRTSQKDCEPFAIRTAPNSETAGETNSTPLQRGFVVGRGLGNRRTSRL